MSPAVDAPILEARTRARPRVGREAGAERVLDAGGRLEAHAHRDAPVRRAVVIRNELDTAEVAADGQVVVGCRQQAIVVRHAGFEVEERGNQAIFEEGLLEGHVAEVVARPGIEFDRHVRGELVRPDVDRVLCKAGLHETALGRANLQRLLELLVIRVPEWIAGTKAGRSHQVTE